MIAQTEKNGFTELRWVCFHRVSSAYTSNLPADRTLALTFAKDRGSDISSVWDCYVCVCVCVTPSSHPPLMPFKFSISFSMEERYRRPLDAERVEWDCINPASRYDIWGTNALQFEDRLLWKINIQIPAFGVSLFPSCGTESYLQDYYSNLRLWKEHLWSFLSSIHLSRIKYVSNKGASIPGSVYRGHGFLACSHLFPNAK